MENVNDVLSKFKDKLDSIISDFKNKISDIEKEEEFIVTLGDVVNYCKSDHLLLPFYDETILSRVFERVFPLSNTEYNKLKAAKYLIESSKSVDKSHFPQYNDAVKDIDSICGKLKKYYNKLLSNDELKKDKDEFNSKVVSYSSIASNIGENGFNSLIDDTALFEEAINACELSMEVINIILNVAIKNNLEFLDSGGVLVEDVSDDIKDMQEQNDMFKSEISDLNNLLGQEEVMKFKNYLVGLLSNIIQDKLKELSVAKDNMKKTEEYKKVEELFSDVNNIVDIDDEMLKDVLLDITDSDTVDGIISNVDMIKIVINGKNNGLDLSLDDSQEDLLKGVYDIVNNYRVELEEKNKETRDYLETFISKCETLSSEIGTGVVRDIETLDEIFSENDVPISDIVKCKFEILSNNSKNYNMNLEGKVKEEVNLRILLRKIDVDLDSYSDIEKRALVNFGDLSNMESLIDFISENNIKFDSNQLFIILLFSSVDILSNILELSVSYEFDLLSLFTIPGVFISSKDKLSNLLNEYKDDSDYYSIENLSYIDACYNVFVDNISLLEANNRSVSDCIKNNILSLIVPDLSKNVTILSGLELSNKIFSIVVINPFLATSLSSFKECGLDDYIKLNPLRLTTSYYRLKDISSNIIRARKNGEIIFRSLSDKKNYWLAKNITRKNSEVI